jgi:hypothetical protein
MTGQSILYYGPESNSGDLTWALRAPAVCDPESVERFLAQYVRLLAARVTREVRNKLKTGLKNPKKHTNGARGGRNSQTKTHRSNVL